MIKIGVEVSRRRLHYDLLDNPGRYFFVLSTHSQAALCIQTCDCQGEDIRTHIIDGFALNRDEKPDYLFDTAINDTLLAGGKHKRQTPEGDEYSISPYLKSILCQLPDLMDWIISSLLARGRNLLIHPLDSD